MLPFGEAWTGSLIHRRSDTLRPAIARVNEQRWITCRVVDYLGFGLTPGDELVVELSLIHI